MKLQNILLIILTISLIVTLSGCLDNLKNPITTNESNTNPNEEVDTTDNTNTPTPSKIISDEKEGDLKITKVEKYTSDEKIPYTAKVVNFKPYKNFILVTVELTKTKNFNPNEKYQISIISSFSHIVLKLVDVDDNLEVTTKYRPKNEGWTEGYQIKIKNPKANKFTLTLVVGDTKKNIVYWKFKTYSLFKINYFKEKSPTKVIYLGSDTIRGIYS